MGGTTHCGLGWDWALGWYSDKVRSQCYAGGLVFSSAYGVWPLLYNKIGDWHNSLDCTDIYQCGVRRYAVLCSSVRNHLKAKFRMYFAQPSFCIFEWCDYEWSLIESCVVIFKKLETAQVKVHNGAAGDFYTISKKTGGWQ